jgi:hypothetical protein
MLSWVSVGSVRRRKDMRANREGTSRIGPGRRGWCVVGILASFAALGAGCDGRKGPNVPAYAGPSDQDQAAAANWCARLKECDLFFFASRYDDDATCVADALAPLAAAMQTPDTGVTDASLLACLNARAAASCESILLGLPTAECTLVPGTRATGAQCYADAQCASLMCLRSSTTVNCGVCSSGKASGEACTADADCEGLLYCVNGVCGELGVVGSACASAGDCVGALRCASNVCAAPLALDAPCTGDADCGLEASCVAGLCQQDQLVGLGETCGSIDGGGRAQCAGLPVCGSGHCVLPPSVGQSCTTDGPDCADQARCTYGVCRQFDASLCPN